MLGAVRDPGVEVAIADRVGADRHRRRRPGWCRRGPRAPRGRPRGPARGCVRAWRPRPGISCSISAAPDVVERVDDDLGLVEALGERRARARPSASRPAGRWPASAAAPCCCRPWRARGPGSSALEQLDRPPRLVLGRRVVAHEPGQAREPAVRVALAADVAGRAVLVERAPAGLDRRSAMSCGQVALVRAALEQLGAAIATAGRPRGAARGRTARPPRGGTRAWPPARRRPARSAARHRASSAASAWWARRAGSGRAPRAASAASALRCSASAPVRARAPPRRRPARSRGGSAPRRARRAARPEARQPSRPSELAVGQRREQPQLGAQRRDRHGVEQRARACSSSRAARASTASRTVSGISVVGRGEHLGHVERVAGGPAMQLARGRPRRAPASSATPVRATAAPAPAARPSRCGSSPRTIRSGWRGSSSSSR